MKRLRTISLRSWTNSEIYDLLLRELFFQERLLFPNLPPSKLRELVYICRLIPWPELIALYNFFHWYRAATPKVIQSILGIPRATLYNVLEFMERRGLIVRVEKASKAEGRPGPKSIIYAVPSYGEKDILKARKMEKMRTTKFLHPVLEGYRLAWKTIEESGRKRIYGRELIALVKEQGLASRYVAYDIAREIGWLLRLDGVEVIW